MAVPATLSPKGADALKHLLPDSEVASKALEYLTESMGDIESVAKKLQAGK